jgi:hypothetical protein
MASRDSSYRHRIVTNHQATAPLRRRPRRRLGLGLEPLERRIALSLSSVYVNSAWSALADGTSVAVGSTGLTIGTNAFATIQSGVTAVGNSPELYNTVTIEDGTYDESNIFVPASMTIQGQSTAGVIVAPSIEDSHDDSTFGGAAVSNGFIIDASGVTIRQLTIDGNANAGLAGSQNFRDAIITNYVTDTTTTFDGLVFDDLAIKNIYWKGIALYNVGSNHSTGNQITNNTFDHVGTAAFSASDFESYGAIAVFQSDTEITGNEITDSGAGILANTAFFTSGSTVADSPKLVITGNTFSDPLTASPSNPVEGFDLASLADGSIIGGATPALGNTIDLSDQGGAGDGLALVVQFANGSVTVENNVIKTAGADTGIYLFHDTDPSHPVLVTANTLMATAASSMAASRAGAGVGIYLTDDGTLFGSAAGATYANLNQNDATGFATGIELNELDDVNVSATITDNVISANTTGISVQGLIQAIADNDLSGNTVAVDNLTATLIDASNNWWGSERGPTSAANPGGNGASITGAAIFSPWIGTYTDATPPADPGFDPSVTAAYAIPTELTFAVQPTSALIGATIMPSPVIEATDSQGHLGINFEGATAVALQEAGAALSGTTTVTAHDGVATFNGLSLTTTGSFQMVATASGLTSATSAPFTVIAPTVTLGGPATAVSGAVYTLNFSAGADAGPPTSWTIDWNDGSALQVLPGTASSVTHIYETPGTFSIVATASYPFGAVPAASSITVNVALPPLTQQDLQQIRLRQRQITQSDQQAQRLILRYHGNPPPSVKRQIQLLQTGATRLQNQSEQLIRAAAQLNQRLNLPPSAVLPASVKQQSIRIQLNFNLSSQNTNNKIQSLLNRYGGNPPASVQRQIEAMQAQSQFREQQFNHFLQRLRVRYGPVSG